MRLVWVVIPILLIGVVGVQESFADDVLPPNIFSEMEFSNIPKIGEIAQITISTHVLPNVTSESLDPIFIIIPPGFELLDAENFTFYEEFLKYGFTNKVFKKIF